MNSHDDVARRTPSELILPCGAWYWYNMLVKHIYLNENIFYTVMFPPPWEHIATVLTPYRG